MNWKIAIGILLQGLGTLGALAEPSEVVRAIAYVHVGSLSIAAAGAALIMGGNRSRGARLVIAGSCLFIPLGLLAIFGARRILDEEMEATFNAVV